MVALWGRALVPPAAPRGTGKGSAKLRSHPPGDLKVWGQLGDSLAPRVGNPASQGPVNAAHGKAKAVGRVAPLACWVANIHGESGGKLPPHPPQAQGGCRGDSDLFWGRQHQYSGWSPVSSSPGRRRP